MTAIGPARLSGIVGISGGGARGTKAGQALTSIAGRIAGRLAEELDLDSRDGHHQGERGGSSGEDIDLYDVIGTARSLNGDLGGRPTDEGMLARSLGLFVTESASLIVARPERASFGLIAAAIEDSERAASGRPETVSIALSTIDRTTRTVATGIRAAA